MAVIDAAIASAGPLANTGGATGLLAKALAEGDYLPPARRSEGTASFVADVQRTTGLLASHDVARTWFFRLWDGLEDSILKRFADAGDRMAAADVMRLHRDAAAGREVSARDWREARKRFLAALSLSASISGRDTLCASMWDLEKVPGAIADVADAWIREASLEDAITAVGWTRDVYLENAEVWDQFLSSRPQIVQEPEESEEDFTERLHQALSEQPPRTAEQMAQWEQLHRISMSRSFDRREALRALLLDTLAASPAPSRHPAGGSNDASCFDVC
ncbi:hypothetical protein [Sphingomonas carotinifaciens]|uniref:Uncharacterized protein n=1 Tax=Sphingomonas carotinifaciens TaxID=1166323 RepID=A0A1G7M311_9SPHN|nr:hypothetical protein [Sphingomonas carotinifaciens]MBB4086940.1 hypothetical protein [Sphingomonas carotinifaciens]MWC42134.1 hypothetical protein [Sphingomonas carotinifaciens]SDF56053.1 hypothetical protein SAMN05216557_10455 [Sphingomonas carotinifaciens]